MGARNQRLSPVIPVEILEKFPDIFRREVLDALQALSHLEPERRDLMDRRLRLRKERAAGKSQLGFPDPDLGIPGLSITCSQARQGQFEGAQIPHDLRRQWVQGTGPAAKPDETLESAFRNICHALLSGADGWMFDGEDALGQTGTMSLTSQRAIAQAYRGSETFLQTAASVAGEMNLWSSQTLGKPMVTNWRTALNFTTRIFRVRGLHLEDRHIRCSDGLGFSAGLADLVLYVVNNYEILAKESRSIVLYIPKIQTMAEAAFWNRALETLELYLELETGSIVCYVLVEQLEASFQLMEIRAALGKHFIGFNTGRWDYINSLSDAFHGDENFINPDIETITMEYPYMAAYEERVAKAVNIPDINGNFALWQGGMEANIPVGDTKAVTLAMEKALAGARRERDAGARGKWVAHWKMVPVIRGVWQETGEGSFRSRSFAPLGYTQQDAMKLSSLGSVNRSTRGARNLISVALQYGNAFLQGYQAAALKPADFFEDETVMFLMEDAATGEIRLSILWEWIHKRAKLTSGEPGISVGQEFTSEVVETLIEEEYQKLCTADPRFVYPSSKDITLPAARMIMEDYLFGDEKAPWYIGYLNACLDLDNLESVREAISKHRRKIGTELFSTTNRSTK